MFRYMVCGKSNGMFSTRWKRTKLRRLKIESLDPILWRMLLLMMFGHIFVGLQNKLYNNFFCLSPLKSCVCIKPLVCSLRMLSPSCYESSASLQTPSYWSNGLYGNNHLFFSSSMEMSLCLSSNSAWRQNIFNLVKNKFGKLFCIVWFKHSHTLVFDNSILFVDTLEPQMKK